MPAEAGIQDRRHDRLDTLALFAPPDWIPACAGMTWSGLRRLSYGIDGRELARKLVCAMNDLAAVTRIPRRSFRATRALL